MIKTTKKPVKFVVTKYRNKPAIVHFYTENSKGIQFTRKEKVPTKRMRVFSSV